MPDITIEYFGQPCGLRFLEPSILEMGAVLDRYTDYYHELSPASQMAYVCGERAALSQLAGGIWRSHPDNFVLEEYICIKKREGSGYKGRTDIWFLANGVRCAAEVKLKWMTLTHNSSPRLAETLDAVKAECDAARLNSEGSKDVDIALGIVFLVPTVSRRNVATAMGHRATLHSFIRLGLKKFTTEEPYVVAWATYQRSDVLDESRLHEGDNNWVASPALEVFFSTKPS